MPFNYERKGNYPSIGYGSDNKKLKQEKNVKVLSVQKHKNHWDYEPGKYFMSTTGKNSEHLDKQLALSFEDIDHLSIRD